MRVLTRPALFIFIFIFAATLLWGAPSEAQYRPVRPWEAGETIGALKVTELDLRHPGKTAIRDLRESLAKHPTLVYFWLPGATVPPGTFEELYALADDARGLRALVVAIPRALMTAEEIANEAQSRGLRAPVLLDEGYQMAQALFAATAPNLSLIDADGVLRLRGGQSLLQPVAGTTSLADWVRAGASAGRFETIRELRPYQAAVETIGKPYTNFTLPRYGEGGEIQLSDYIKPGTVTAIFFWSPTCPHCKEALPSVQAARRKFGDKLNFVSVTQLPTPSMREACADAVEKYKIDFPIAVDETGEALSAYRVQGTPTTVLVDPNGIVGNCAFFGDTDYVELIGAEIAKIGKL